MKNLQIIKQQQILGKDFKIYDTVENPLFLAKDVAEWIDYNMPTQRSMEQELFEIKETSISHSDGHVTVNKTPKISGKGQQYFINKFLKYEVIAEIACTEE